MKMTGLTTRSETIRKITSTVKNASKSETISKKHTKYPAITIINKK